MHAGTTANEVIKEDAFGDDKAKGADLRKNKIKEMDASIKLLMKHVAESNARDKTITKTKQKELTDEQKQLTGKKKQKELTNEQKHQGDPGSESLRLHATVLRPAGLVQVCNEVRRGEVFTCMRPQCVEPKPAPFRSGDHNLRCWMRRTEL